MKTLGDTTKTKETRAGATPTRTCLGCGHKRPKASLRRLVVDEAHQLSVDFPQVSPGRGAYLCGPGCYQAALKRRAFQRAFRSQVALGVQAVEASLQSRE